MKRKKKIECLFLGYDEKKTCLINFLKSKKINVTKFRNRTLFLKFAKKFDCIISFGYRKIISKNVIQNLDRPVINLHISYLPYNRGAYSNYWSFINDTPKGVTIHEVDEGIDTGKIIYRKRLYFKINKTITFTSTYKVLINEIEKLFKKNFKKIIFKNYRSRNQPEKMKLKLKKDIKTIPDWNKSILQTIATYKT